MSRVESHSPTGSTNTNSAARTTQATRLESCLIASRASRGAAGRRRQRDPLERLGPILRKDLHAPAPAEWRDAYELAGIVAHAESILEHAIRWIEREHPVASRHEHQGRAHDRGNSEEWEPTHGRRGCRQCCSCRRLGNGRFGGPADPHIQRPLYGPTAPASASRTCSPPAPNPAAHSPPQSAPPDTPCATQPGASLRVAFRPRTSHAARARVRQRSRERSRIL